MDAISQWMAAMGVSPMVGGAIVGVVVGYILLRAIRGDQSVKAKGANARPGDQS